MPLLIIQLIFNNWYWVYYVIKDARGEKMKKQSLMNKSIILMTRLYQKIFQYYRG